MVEEHSPVGTEWACQALGQDQTQGRGRSLPSRGFPMESEHAPGPHEATHAQERQKTERRAPTPSE